MKRSSFSEAFFEKLLAKMAERFSESSQKLPGVSCVSRAMLKRELVVIRDELSFAGHKRVTADTIIRHLLQSGLLSQVPLEGEDRARRHVEVYLVGLGSATSVVSPVELLTAIEPYGVVCFFSALQIYELTTQLPSHHNVAVLTKASSRGGVRARIDGNVAASVTRRQRNPMGEFVFSFGELPYYRNRRCRKLVPGVKWRYLGQKTRYRVTTMEQTLLDMLQHPLPCGGPAVVFEAWENALLVFDEERLLEYLMVLRNDVLARRVGSMLDFLAHECGSGLAQFLGDVRSRMTKEETAYVSLLAGMHYLQPDKKWLTRRP